MTLIRSVLAVSVVLVSGCDEVALRADAGADAMPSSDTSVTADARVPSDASADAPRSALINPRLADLRDGEARDLGAFICTDPPGAYRSCVTVTDYSGFAYDSTHHQMLMYGGGHAATSSTAMWSLDLSGDLVWHEAVPSTPIAEMTLSNLDARRGRWISTGHPLQVHTYDYLTYVPARDELVLMQGNEVALFTMGYPSDFPSMCGAEDEHHYAPSTRTWTGHPVGPRWAVYGASSLDPSGLILYMSRYGLWTYDPETSAVGHPLDAVDGSLGIAQNLVYAENAGAHFHLRSDGVVHRLNYVSAAPSTSTVTRLATSGPTPPIAIDVLVNPDASETGWAYDGRRGRICGGLHRGFMYCLNTMTNVWTSYSIESGPEVNLERIAFHALQYDPINDAFIFLTARTLSLPMHTVAWRPPS